MASLRILLVDKAGPFRDALARALSSGGHEVRVADSVSKAANDFAAEFVVYGEGSSEATVEGGSTQIALRRPVNMEELRRVLRDS
jgi:hypothetical protein